MYVIVYNPKSKGGKSKDVVEKIVERMNEMNETYRFQNFLEVQDTEAFINSLQDDEHPVFVGGDGTLHLLANAIEKYKFTKDIYAYPSGTGNDFFRNINQFDKNIVRINEYMENLPVYKSGDLEEVFLNGIGVGIDGLVCQYVAEDKGGNAFSYYKNTVKAFFKYKPHPMTVTIDGVKHHYKKCWLTVCMNGIYAGGGMKFGPLKTRNDGTLDVMVVHSLSKLQLVLLFGKIYKGTQIKLKKYVDYINGKDIKIEAEGLPPMQTDGEVHKNIKELIVKAR